ncbi:protein mono-ADP-ribosyltransferase TIPARP isoform X2 [Microtus oregoni]|uniref:protein mono-ADP-ribosyltransferase TIPARP isoform X2 n=1 Tax=Microtus oregoni TaxID=111838 RepID=UPI001BB2BCF1|nr:protein mono-ADP-ribosyltransferase TIPARP isoform X2 [Microtus oregoni]
MEMETTEPEPDCVVQPPSPPDDFSCQMRISEKIAPLKTCFKKKQDQKRLGTGTLRSLRPILNTLLESGSLGGVFRARDQNADESTLHEQMVKKPLEINPSCSPAENSMSVLMPDGTNIEGQLPEAHPSADAPEQVVPIQDHSFPPETISGTVADSTPGHFQTDLLHPVSGDVPTSPDCIDKVDFVPGAFQDDSCTIQYILDTSDNLSTELFQDKSDEASLDIVFELVNQLQYHTHQENGIEICMDFLQGICDYGRDCLKHHTRLPYHWQIRRTTTQKWQSVSNDSQEHLERFYCNPENDRMRMKYGGQDFWADLNAMTVFETTEFDQLRRLCTPPCKNTSSLYNTFWKFFCRDHFGWREYPESVVRLIEDANSQGLKEVRFMMWNNHYILHNSFFRREIKRRPLFRSCFILIPYLKKKEYMNRKMFGRDRIINERHLFHGTSQDVVDGICKHNFDPRVCGKHATMFGQGSYFAKKASYSHNFSKKSSKGVHFMFLAKVLTGRYTMGSHGMRRPPPVNPGSVTSDLYDSCVDNFFEPQIFVIFNDDQSYPYFVIQYEEVSNTVSI